MRQFGGQDRLNLPVGPEGVLVVGQLEEHDLIGHRIVHRREDAETLGIGVAGHEEPPVPGDLDRVLVLGVIRHPGIGHVRLDRLAEGLVLVVVDVAGGVVQAPDRVLGRRLVEAGLALEVGRGVGEASQRRAHDPPIQERLALARATGHHDHLALGRLTLDRAFVEPRKPRQKVRKLLLAEDRPEPALDVGPEGFGTIGGGLHRLAEVRVENPVVADLHDLFVGEKDRDGGVDPSLGLDRVDDPVHLRRALLGLGLDAVNSQSSGQVLHLRVVPAVGAVLEPVALAVVVELHHGLADHFLAELVDEGVAEQLGPRDKGLTRAVGVTDHPVVPDLAADAGDAII